MRTKIEQPKLLIVEGNDEREFFAAAMRDHLAITDVQPMPIGGKTNLRQNLSALVNDPQWPAVRSLAIVRDADSPLADAKVEVSSMVEAAKAFESVRGSLHHVRLNCPEKHGNFTDGPPRVGVFIMPNGADDGMLETLCLQAASNSTGYSCVDQYVRCLEESNIIPRNLH
jgi:hypothetical protein